VVLKLYTSENRSEVCGEISNVVVLEKNGKIIWTDRVKNEER
jgi:hypothetical protein